MDDETKDFEKKLAVINLKATVASTLGSILISVGFALFIFSYTISQNPSIAGNPVYSDYIWGLLMIVMGIGILVGSLSKKTSEIKKL